MKAELISSDGKKSGEVELPRAFGELVREDIISRAAISDQTYLYQPKGAYPFAGIQTSAKYRGRKEDFGSIKNHGIAMLPREVLAKGRFGKVRRIPSSVKGRRAHPPKVEKMLIERMNKKEYRKALHSAIAASASSSYIIKRGHKLPEKISLPIVLDDSCEKISKTKNAMKLLQQIGLGNDLNRAAKTKRRSGVGSRKGGAKRAKSLLVVVHDINSPIAKAARNLAGVDVVLASKLKVIDLAPGAKCGRLAAYTKSSLEMIGKL